MGNKRVISAVLTLKDKDFSSGVKKAASGTTDFERKIKQSSNTVSNFGSSAVSAFKNVALNAAALTGAFAGIAGISDIASSVIETESAFNRLSAKTGATGKELEGLKGTAKDVFNAGFGESVGEVANDIGKLKGMFNDLGKNDFKNLAMGANTIADLYDVGTEEVGKSVKTMTANFKGLSQTDALDLMTTAFQKTGDYSGDLLDTFNEYSPYFSAMGMSAKDFTNILIKGSEAGAFNMDKVGDAVKEFSIRSIDGSKGTAEGFKAIGLNADDMAQKIAAGGDSANTAFAATISALSTMKNPVEQNAAGVALFGTQWEDVRSKVVLAMADGKDAVGQFKGATKEAEATMHSGFGDRMLSMWRTLKTTIADSFTSNGGNELLSSLASSAESLIPIFSSLVSTAVSGVSTIVSNWSSISGVISALSPILAGTAAGLAAFKIGIIAVTAVQNAWKIATSGVQIATALLNGTLAISPLGWVAIAIGAVIAVGVLLWKNWDTVRAAASSLWSGLKTAFSGIMSAAQSFISPVVGFFQSLIDKWNSFKSAVANFKMPKISLPSLGGLKKYIPGFASGTNSAPGGIAQVHEKGGEIIDLPRGSRVYPHDKSVAMARAEGAQSAGGNVINININGVGKSTNEIVNELVPALKMRLANI
ncbi:phage tail tape measure protein [Rummeliibacillus sp. NPDC094406]|uniref:phage tail tape measure protein n=1 Tax=Rummeliibacillus sp. NPDC094406 TaxID=3364511 RepID=UPI0037F7C290